MLVLLGVTGPRAGRTVIAPVPVLLGVILVCAFVALFDANQYKQDLSTLVQQQTGRDLLTGGHHSVVFTRIV